MKLQNTLFIATAICFDILLCSQPTDSFLFIHWLETTMTVSTRDDTSAGCSHNRTCSDPEKYTCSAIPYENETKDYCAPKTVFWHDIYETCSDTEPCSNPNEYTCTLYEPENKMRGYCEPRCNSDRSCSNKNHRCVWSVKFYFNQFCLQITDDEWDLLDDCNDHKCDNDRFCHHTTGKSSTKCLY